MKFRKEKIPKENSDNQMDNSTEDTSPLSFILPVSYPFYYGYFCPHLSMSVIRTMEGDGQFARFFCYKDSGNK
jgi:hypothetical protein